MPQVTPESTIILKLRSGFPSTLIAAMMVTSRITMPVLPMLFKNTVRKKVLGRKLGARSSATSRKRNMRMVF